MYNNDNGFTIYDGLNTAKFMIIAVIVALILFVAFILIRDIVKKHISNSQTALLKYVEENSPVLSELRKLNSKYDFHDSIEYCYTIPYSGFKSRAAFDKASIMQYALQVIGRNSAFYISAIEKASENDKNYKEYRQILSSIKLKITEQNWSELSYFKKKRAYQYESLLFNRLELHPVTFTSLDVKKTYSSPHGRNKYFDIQHFSSSQMLDLIDNYQKQQKAEYERKQTAQYQRSALTPSLRYDILKRDKFRCVLCGSSADDGASLEVDHIVPVAKGGKTEMNNLRTLCHTCNAGKSDKYTPGDVN